MIRKVRQSYVILSKEKDHYHCIMLDLYSPGDKPHKGWFSEGSFLGPNEVSEWENEDET